MRRFWQWSWGTRWWWIPGNNADKIDETYSRSKMRSAWFRPKKTDWLSVEVGKESVAQWCPWIGRRILVCLVFCRMKRWNVPAWVRTSRTLFRTCSAASSWTWATTKHTWWRCWWDRLKWLDRLRKLWGRCLGSTRECFRRWRWTGKFCGSGRLRKVCTRRSGRKACSAGERRFPLFK